MPSPLLPFLVRRIRERGPLTVAEYMELALYQPEHGYYARAAQRSGRDGDFFTSVDVGPLFGRMIAVQIEEMWRVLGDSKAGEFQLVEAAAGNGRLMRDVLDGAAAEQLAFPAHARVTLVERSAAACSAQNATFRGAPGGVPDSRPDLPSPITGVVYANELLDALPVHVVQATEGGLEEVYVDADADGLAEKRGPLSDPAIAEYVSNLAVEPPRGSRFEVGLAAAAWVRRAASALAAGFLLLFDYGHDVTELYSPLHAGGTLTTYRHHSVGARHWLADPGEADLTSHVNITAVRKAAESSGLQALGTVDQMYFLTSLGIVDRLPGGTSVDAITRRLAAKTLLMPGGLGSTIKVMIFARNVGRPALRGLSSGRMT